MLIYDGAYYRAAAEYAASLVLSSGQKPKTMKDNEVMAMRREHREFDIIERPEGHRD
jgi:hypothetical protein